MAHTRSAQSSTVRSSLVPHVGQARRPRRRARRHRRRRSRQQLKWDRRIPPPRPRARRQRRVRQQLKKDRRIPPHPDREPDPNRDTYHYPNPHSRRDDASRDAHADPHSHGDSAWVGNCNTDARRRGNGDAQGPATDRRGRSGRQQRPNNAPAGHRFGCSVRDCGGRQRRSCWQRKQEITLSQWM